MRESRRCLFDGIRGWIAAMAMLVAMTLVVAACASGGDTTKFPTGRFVHEEWDDIILEFDEDGTWRRFDGDNEVPSNSGKYATNGNLWTQMTHDFTPVPARQVPATYTWTYDGQNLTFHVWGEDVNPSRKAFYHDQTYIKVE